MLGLLLIFAVILGLGVAIGPVRHTPYVRGWGWTSRPWGRATSRRRV